MVVLYRAVRYLSSTFMYRYLAGKHTCQDMARKKKHALQQALEALGRAAKEVQHFVCDGTRVEVFFCDPIQPVTAQSSAASPYARPAYVPGALLGQSDVDDTGTGADSPVEAMDLLKARR